jgi:hypothetical protein
MQFIFTATATKLFCKFVCRDIPSEQDLLTSSYKVGVELSDDDILAIWGELLTALSQQRKIKSEGGQRELETVNSDTFLGL